jgi:hypothetical protein
MPGPVPATDQRNSDAKMTVGTQAEEAPRRSRPPQAMSRCAFSTRRAIIYASTGASVRTPSSRSSSSSTSPCRWPSRPRSTAWLHDEFISRGYQVEAAHPAQVAGGPGEKNPIHAHLVDLNLVSPKTDLFGRQGRLWLSTLALPEDSRFQVELFLEMLDELDLRIRRVSNGSNTRWS